MKSIGDPFSIENLRRRREEGLNYSPSIEEVSKIWNQKRLPFYKTAVFWLRILKFMGLIMCLALTYFVIEVSPQYMRNPVVLQYEYKIALYVFVGLFFNKQCS